jgi:hypothetical protein
MKPININQEILLFTGTSFTRQQFSNINTTGHRSPEYSLIEELERASWEGILCELIPELPSNPFPCSKLFVWNILTAEHFLLVNKGIYPQAVATETSVDPHLFLPGIHLN